MKIKIEIIQWKSDIKTKRYEVTIMQMYEVTAMAPEGPEEVYQAVIFAEDEDDALNQLEEQLKEQNIAHGMCMAEEV